MRRSDASPSGARFAELQRRHGTQPTPQPDDAYSRVIDHLFTSAGLAFAALLPIFNPIGAVGAFLGLTVDMEKVERRRQAGLAAVAAAALVSGFLLAGHYVLSLFGVLLSAVEAVGGLLIGYVGWQMATQPVEHPTGEEHGPGDIFLNPLVFPLLAGPGALAVSLGLSSRNDSWLDFPGFILGVSAVCFVTFLAMILAEPISNRLGSRGIEIIVRVMGVIVLAVAAEMVFHGIGDHFGLTLVHV